MILKSLVLELIKEKFSKLLLGEDMSGSGKGVCPAVAISNAITNLYGRLSLTIMLQNLSSTKIIKFSLYIYIYTLFSNCVWELP